MSDIRTLIRSTPPFGHKIGPISDEVLKNIESFIDDVNILPLRLAQLKYNQRVLRKERIWWDDLGVFLGVPQHTVRDANIVEFMIPVPFGLLYEVFETTGCNIQIAIEHDWNVLQDNHLLHTDVSEFSEYCLKQEFDLDQEDGIFCDYNLDEWGVELEELQRQIVTEPYENLTKKKTLAVIEILHDRKSKKAVQVLKTVLDVIQQIQTNQITFSEVEKFVVFEREFLPDTDKYLIERKKIEDFSLQDLFDFGTEIMELSIYFDDDFDHFKENVENFVTNKSDGWFKDIHYTILEKTMKNS